MPTVTDPTAEATVRPDAPEGEVTQNVTVNVPTPETVDNFPDEMHEQLGFLQTAAPVIVTEAKKGYKTTEFWLTVASGLAIWLDTVPLPEKVEGYVIGAIALAYILSRGIAKAGVPVEKPVDPA